MPELRTPVLVGAAAIEQRCDDPHDACEALELMIAAAEAAVADAGSAALADRIDVVMAPRGFWGYADPGRALAARFGIEARTVVAEIGVLQTTLFARAAEAIRDGRAEIVLVVGGEARHRAQQAARAGVEVLDTDQGEISPTEVWRPAADIFERVEIERNLVMPAHAYAVMENAWRAANGLTLADHTRDLARLWTQFSEVAETNPHAWERSPRPAGEPFLAFPYTKRHVSQWNVDQAAALVLCSTEVARSLGLPSDRWIYPRAIVDCNEMVPLVRRRDLHRAPGFEMVARRIFEMTSTGIDDVADLELYSCFPVAVRVQQHAFGSGHRVPTVTGGMAFAGGPLNNFVLQAMVRMVEVIREQPGLALVTAVSGMLTKQGASLWSTDQPGRFETDDVPAAAPQCEVESDATGEATFAGYTVVHDRNGRAQGIAVCDVDSVRTIAVTTDAEMMASMEREEWCGHEVVVEPAGVLEE